MYSNYSTNFLTRSASLYVLSFVLLVLTSCRQTGESSSHLPPETNRFTSSILSKPGELDEPMAFTFLSKNEMLIVERKGGVKSFDTNSRTMKTIGHIPVNTKYINKQGQSREAEEGLIGVIADPDYATNHWVYMLYADPDKTAHVLARWELKDGTLDESTKKIVLSYHAQREVCCHTGGGMAFDKDGNLFITTGNNTANPPSGTSNLDMREGQETSDDQRTGGNTNDLRGKILRIHPEADGTYTIPEGNLFEEGNPKARAEIYTMGHRNPWRVSIDSETGYIYWGEVGPDASEDTDTNPRGYDEFNQAKGPGFFGWPYFIGNNIPYADTTGKPFDVNNVVNNSPNNTGLTQLPKPQPAMIWYPYGYSEEFPAMGSSGRSATGGPVYRQADFPASDKRFPSYYEGKWLIVEFMRGWIMAVSMDENGDYMSMERFLPEENFSSAIDMQFSPEGDLYVLEYGSAWFRGNDNAHIKRIEYNGGNRKPIVKASAEKQAGALPFTTQLSSAGTKDYDNDRLKYEWQITSENGYSKTYSEANPSITLEEAGVYAARLTVTDKAGSTNEQVLELIAGNEPPKVELSILEGNQSFFFPGQALRYDIKVADQEDGSLEGGEISKEAIAINFDYAPEGFDPIEIAQNHKSTDDWIVFSAGRKLIDGSDCFSCHKLNETSIGPSYQAVADKYKADPASYSKIAERIINGSVGIWGEHAMAAHPDLSKRDAQHIVKYIMSLGEAEAERQSLALSGEYIPQVPKGENGNGGYLLRVAYTDQGSAELKPLSSEKIIALRNPKINIEQYDATQGTQLLTSQGRSFNIIQHDAYVAYFDLDLTGVGEISIGAEASARNGAPGAVIELRLDAPDGELVGQTEKIIPVDIDFRAEMRKAVEAWEKGGKKGPRPGFRDVIRKLRPKFSIPLNGIQGKHQVYFVFKNPEAKDGQVLLKLNDIEFKAIKETTL